MTHLEGIPLSTKSKKRIARKHYAEWRNKTKESKTYIAILFAMSNGVCPQCSRDMYLSFSGSVAHQKHPRRATLDHISPIASVIEHSKFGLQIMCNECNTKKADGQLPIN